jgi:cytochrome c553
VRARVLLALLTAYAPAIAAAQAGRPVPPAGASSCSGCHSTSRFGAAIPPLAGQPADEIAAAMRDFASGKRTATVMDHIARGFSDEETRAIATWLSQQR